MYAAAVDEMRKINSSIVDSSRIEDRYGSRVVCNLKAIRIRLFLKLRS